MRPLFVLSLMLCSANASAILPYAFQQGELDALPQFCIAKMQGNDGAVGEQFGRQNWMHMHHYCHGLKFVNRARVHARDRVYYLQRASAEFEYVIRHSEAGFWFRPQIYLDLSKVARQLGDTGAAQQHLYAAIGFNPSYEAAYVSLIELQVGMAARGLALETATEGLKHLPESKRLQKAYLDNGGKRPFPEAVVKAAPPAPAKADSLAPGQPSDTSQAESATASPGAVEPQQTSTEPAAERGCRFCPPDEIQQRWRESFQTGQ